MKTSETQSQYGTNNRKTGLSPDVKELLHMLSALEAGLDAKVLTAR